MGKRHAPWLPRATLIAVVAASAAAVMLVYLTHPALPLAWRTPGSPELYLTGVAGAVLALVPFAFSLAKRSGASADPPLWFALHAVGASAGVALLFVHSGFNFGRPPTLVLVCAVALVLQGAWARAVLARDVADTFGTKHHAFRPPGDAERERLAHLITAKTTLLERLAPGQSEALFSPTLGHWLRKPVATWRYTRLAQAEMKLIGQRRQVSAAQAWWRATHIALAFFFLVGLAVHVVTVTFFAGYVAGAAEITWWHLAAW